MKGRILKITVAMALLAAPVRAEAQKVSVGTNLLDYADLATLNLETSFALARHWSLSVDAKYNPFTFHKDGGQMQRRQQSYSVGCRWWAWYVWSGWWTASALKYQEYSWGGIGRTVAEEGDRLGASFYAGYSYMLGPHLNLDMSLGFFTGLKWYSVYSCPTCGVLLDKGMKFFILPDNIRLALDVIF
ncbi:MAG: DUF3575 domain-containing protein [Bacteroidales bacterium]|nr:DUF3575 domain-containing protein [Bacteroidales bacterium]